MESKSANKAIIVISFVLSIVSILTSFILFIARDTILNYCYPNMATKRLEWDFAYIHSENIHAFVVFFLTLFAFGATMFMREVNKDERLGKIIKWGILFSVIFSGISTSDISDRLAGEYEFKPLVDKVIMIITVIIAATQYGNQQNIRTNTGS